MRSLRSPPAFFVRCTEVVVSPCCGDKLKVIGSKARKYKDSMGEQVTLRIRRMRCTCGKIHHELPDMLVPYKRYEAACIEKVVSDSADSREIAIDEATVYRWKAWFKGRVAYWVGCLVSIAMRFKLPVEVRSLPSQSVHQRMIPLQILTLSVQLDPVDFLFYPLAEKNVEYGAFTKRFLA